MTIFKTIIILFLTTSNLYAKNKKFEKEYQAIDCKARGGKTEVAIKVTKDGLNAQGKKDYKYLKKLKDAINYHDLYIKIDEIKNLN